MNVSELSLRRPVLVTVVFLIVCILGAVSFTRLPIDLMPDITFPTLTVQTNYTGVGPEEMEELITIPLERSLASTPSLEEMTSTSSEGSSNVRMSFSWSTDLDSAADEIRTRVDRARGQLPDDATTPTIFKFDLNALPVMFLGVSSDSLSDRELLEFVEDEVVYRLERIPGVAQAQPRGGLSREIRVELNREKLNALRLTPALVINAIRRDSVTQPVGEVIEGDFETLMRTEGQYESLDEIRETMVARRQGQVISVGDVAEIFDTSTEVRSYTRINGAPGVRLGVVKQSGANTVDVADGIIAEVDRMNRELSQTRITVISDTSQFIRQAVRNVRNAALWGSLFAVLILMLFLRNLRSTLVVSIAIPISVIGTFALMYFSGFTLNTITFGGLALGVGMLVDNAIVVIENIFRHRQGGLTRGEAARRGTSEVSTAITASTLTTIVVFLPVVFTTGVSGAMFQQLAWVVSFALFTSLLVALTLIPLLSSRLIRVEEPSETSWAYPIVHTATRALDALDRSYADGLRWALRHRASVILGTILLFGGSVALIPMIGVELQPQTDEGEIQINLTLPEGSRLDAADIIARRVEGIVAEQIPEASRVLTEVGGGGGFGGFRGAVNGVTVQVTLVSLAERGRSTQEIVNSILPTLTGMPGVLARARSSQSMTTRIASRVAGGSNGGERLSVDIRGYDLQAAVSVGQELRRIMENTSGISDASVNRGSGRPEARVRIDRTRAAVMGMSVFDIAATLGTSVGGTVATQFRQGGDEYPILVRFREQDRQTSGDVLAIPMLTPGGDVVPLRSVASLDRAEGPTSIQRKDQERTITVSANLDGTRDLGSVVTELQQSVRTLDLGSDLAIAFGGEWQEQQESFNSTVLSIVLAIVLVYLVMAAQFESFKYPMLIMFAIPLSVIGVSLMLFLTDTTMNVQAGIGLIMLVGIVVNNAIVLVDYVLQLIREHEFALVDALVTAGRRRLRPILMTTLTTVLGLAPMALGIGEGGELQAPMGRVIIGGLTSSMLITLFLVPVLFHTLESFSWRPARREFVGGPESETGGAELRN